MNVLITGASNGIGEGLLKAYIDMGYHVYNFDYKEPIYKHDHAHYIKCDLADEQAINETYGNLPNIDLLIINAATFDQKDFFSQSLKDIKHIVAVNLFSAIQLAQLYSKQYVGHTGRIVLLSSTRAYMSEKNTIGYSVSKGGITSLTHSLAMTLQDKHITVNAIAPGWINSHHDDLREVDHQFHPSKRVGIIEDVVRTCLFLTDEHASFINGEVITVDGGVTKKMIYPED